MIIKKSRHISILLAIMNHDGIITSEDLAIFSKSSSRSVKSDIVKLNEDLMKEGIAKIVATRSKGYYIEVINHNKFEELRSSLSKTHVYFFNDDIEITSRRLFIAQKLLLNEYTRVDDLAESFYLSKSAIKSELKWITNFFSSYNVKLTTVVGKGLIPCGNEENLRSLMVEVFCSQYLDLNIEFGVKEFRNLFYEEEEYYADLRHAFLKILRESKMSVLDINTKKLATYLCLMQQRWRKGKRIHVDDKTRETIQKQYEYQVATEIFETQYITSYDEDEKVHFALLLMCYRDVDLLSKNDQETISPIIRAASNYYLDELIDKLKNELGGELFRLELFEVFRNSFLSLLIPIYTRSKYDSNAKMRMVTYYNKQEIASSPIALDIARRMLVHSQKILNDKIDEHVFWSVPPLIDLMFQSINFQYNKRRLGIISLAGRTVGKQRADILYRKFGNYIDKIDIFNQYELRRINFDDYDGVLVDTECVYNYYPIKFYKYTGINDDNEIQTLFNELFTQGFASEIVTKLSHLTNVFSSFQCHNYMEFFHLMCYKHALQDMEEQLMEYFIEKGTRFSFYNKNSQISMIFGPYEYIGEEFIEIYHLNYKMIWQKPYEIKYIIFICLDPNKKISELKIINLILFNLYHHPKCLKEMFENIEETYRNYFLDIITPFYKKK